MPSLLEKIQGKTATTVVEVEVTEQMMTVLSLNSPSLAERIDKKLTQKSESYYLSVPIYQQLLVSESEAIADLEAERRQLLAEYYGHIAEFTRKYNATLESVEEDLANLDPAKIDLSNAKMTALKMLEIQVLEHQKQLEANIKPFQNRLVLIMLLRTDYDFKEEELAFLPLSLANALFAIGEAERASKDVRLEQKEVAGASTESAYQSDRTEGEVLGEKPAQ